MQKILYGMTLVLISSWGMPTLAQKNLSADEFEKKLSVVPNAQVLDVRTPEEYAEGHLKNARNLNVQGENFEKDIAALDKTKPVLVYCLSGGRSSQAMNILLKQGFKEVYNMEGGYMKWSLNGKPTEGAAAPKADEMSSHQLEELIKSNSLVLIDYNAKWCGPCKKLLPIVEKVKAEYASRLTVVAIDVDKNKILTKQKGVGALPALVLYKNGRVVWQQVGMTDEATIKKEIRKHI